MFDYIVVGAGVGGLFIANELVELNKKIIVFESQHEVGGRCITTSHRREKGAWRIHVSHERVMKLMKKLNITYNPTRSSKIEKEQKQDLHVAKRAKKGMTLFETMMLKHGITKAQLIDQNTGYMGITKTSRRSYSTDNNEFVVPTKGMQEIPIQLAKKLNEKIVLNARVAYIKYDNLKKRYDVYIMIRNINKSNEFTRKKYHAKNIILNSQPVHFPDTNFNRKLSLIKSCVGTEPLTHVYVTLDKPLPPTYKVTNDLLGQVVSVTPKQLMISYSGGDLATFHYHFHMNHKKEYIAMLQKLFPCKFTDVQVFYHEHGVGLWKPNPSGQTVQLMEKCAVIHPVLLPGLYCVNENISARYHGWMEGALEVADLVIQYINKEKKHKILTTMPKQYLIYDKRVLDVQEWKKIHPGSEQAIKNHLGEDVTWLFDNIHSTKSEPLQYILGLQAGFVHD